MIFEDEPVPGYPLPILPGHTSPGRFERVLRAGQFAVTSELAPPDSADPEDVYRRARIFDGHVDAINATDGSGANCHMSSLAVCALLTRMGYAPVMQISCRDKNRIAIQGDILGGAAMGVCNLLCLTGDGVQAGDHPQALPVFDLDSLTLLETARTLRDEHHFLSGRKITYAPRVLLGAAENPFAKPFEWRTRQMSQRRGGHYVFQVVEAAQFDLRPLHKRVTVPKKLLFFEPHAIGHALRGAEPNHFTARTGGEPAAGGVVVIQHREIVLLLRFKQASLGVRVNLKRMMAI